MSVVRVDLNVSVDGVGIPGDWTPDDPFGKDWTTLTKAFAATRTFRERVLGETEGRGTTGIDDKYAKASFEGVGAEIMGAGMFGLHLHRDDPDWRGWWGAEPPFRCPVFVLTHEERPDLEMEGGTTFHFLSAEPAEVLERAREAAGDEDVRIGGGLDVVRTFAKEGLIDRLHIAIAPYVLGDGERLWDGLRGFEGGYTVSGEVAESGTIHLTYSRRA